ncbi:MAG: DUF72 domain-containing protein [Cyanobacteria bacterium P01_G01_bin.38]
MADQDLQFRIGCAVWAYKEWLGNFYPKGSRPANFLRLYGERMTTVEGNTTFYHTPTPETVARWATETPETFRFCPKLPRSVTHDGLLMPHLPTALDFLTLMQGLGTRLGPIFAQLPPGYAPTHFQDLADFLSAWPREVAPLAVEVRHLDWFKPPHATQLNALLMRLGVGRVLLDTRTMYEWEDATNDPQLKSERRKPKVPMQPVLTAPFTLVRYISHPQLSRNQEYLSQWVDLVGQWLAKGTEIYFFVHCPIEAESPAIAKHVQTLLEQANVAVPPLPWDQLTQPPEQLALF